MFLGHVRRIPAIHDTFVCMVKFCSSQHEMYYKGSISGMQKNIDKIIDINLVTSLPHRNPATLWKLKPGDIAEEIVTNRMASHHKHASNVACVSNGRQNFHHDFYMLPIQYPS